MKTDKRQDRIMTGLIGNVDVYLLNGQTVMRGRRCHSKRKPSDKIQRHLSSFRAQKNFAREAMIPLIRRIWNHCPLSGGMNGYNLFMKTNSRAFNDCDQIVFPELLSVSEGILCPVIHLSISCDRTALQCNWETTGFSVRCNKDDRLNIAFLLHRSSIELVISEAQRKDGKATVRLPDNTDSPIEGYLFWSSADDRFFSPSIYWHCEKKEGGN